MKRMHTEGKCNKSAARRAWVPLTDRAERIYDGCLAAGLPFKISAGSMLTQSPPLTISKADWGRALGSVASAVLAEV
ncbi:hypothetical protein ACEN2J_13275 [Pseudorhodobacter sp. W20_MBD10_FR17]|uniref:hypothetical protein n=1 Tax=Pseudorhodobacter sp. W20_MBD10_FR17 TaxID=3240266 RepID=UPI003F98DB8E